MIAPFFFYMKLAFSPTSYKCARREVIFRTNGSKHKICSCFSNIYGVLVFLMLTRRSDVRKRTGAKNHNLPLVNSVIFTNISAIWSKKLFRDRIKFLNSEFRNYCDNFFLFSFAGFAHCGRQRSPGLLPDHAAATVETQRLPGPGA